MKEFELPHIFDSFYRGSNTKNQKGSGLGLYICKQLMHKMDGEIYAEIMDKGDFIVTVVIRKIRLFFLVNVKNQLTNLYRI